MEELPEGTQNEYNPNINRIRPSPHEPDSEPPSRRTTGDGAGRAGVAPTGVPHCLSCSTVRALLAASTGAPLYLSWGHVWQVWLPLQLWCSV